MTTYIPSLTLPAFIFEKPAVAILLPMALGNAVGWSTRPDKTKARYLELKQPPGNPPAWIFGPVWTALYCSMGYASYRAWNAGLNSFNAESMLLAKQGATLYTIQLGLNLIWMPLFFGFERPVASAVDIVTLLGTTGYLTYIWHKIDTTAAWLMVPYMAWLSFASYLCIGCGYLNGWDFKAVPRKIEKKKE